MKFHVKYLNWTIVINANVDAWKMTGIIGGEAVYEKWFIGFSKANKEYQNG